MIIKKISAPKFCKCEKCNKEKAALKILIYKGLMLLCAAAVLAILLGNGAYDVMEHYFPLVK